MKRIANSWIVSGLAATLWLSAGTETEAQTKTYQQILYGEAVAPAAAATEPLVNEATAEKHDRKPAPVVLDSGALRKMNATLIADAYVSARVADKRDVFYRANNFHTKWLYDSEPSPLYYALLQNLRNADIYGLNPDDYDADGLDKAVLSLYAATTANAEDVRALDVRITEVCLLFTTHLREGKIRTAGYSNKIWLRSQQPVTINDAVALAEATSPKDLDKMFDSVQPDTDQYRKLQEAFSHYHDLAQHAPEKLPLLSVSGTIDPLSRHKAIPLVRKRLSQFDLKVYPTTIDTVTGVWDTLLYDRGLVQGIVAFQIIHGLKPDGVIGPMTVTYLNKSLQSRAEAIAVNLDRIRWTAPVEKEAGYIVVNIPEYTLRIFEEGSETFQMRVIVGAVENPTPVFRDRVEHVVFSPTWTVPVSIIKNEIIPRLKSNPDYYTEKNYVFYKNGEKIDPAGEAWGTTSAGSYRIVQQSGGDNSLGRVKFGMNNSMRIYLHDTPSQRLFAKDYRALSHGCIRLDEPALFAAYLLRSNSGWDMERINKQMFSGNASTVLLKKTYPVHVQYCTAWVDDTGRVNFRDDIYGHDRMQLQELTRPALKESGIIAGL